jgi:hypothetical protein
MGAGPKSSSGKAIPMDVIDTRYSSDMQSPLSCLDQERKVRKDLDSLGIDHRLATVIHNEAESGTKVFRETLRRLIEMRDRGEIGILFVDDQARLTRACNAHDFILDLVRVGIGSTGASPVSTELD